MGLMLGIAIAEATMRGLGYKPNPFNVNSAITGDTKYTFARPDPEIGWVNKAGTPLAAEGTNEKMTILEDGQRVNATHKLGLEKIDKRVAVIGCSMTMGYGVKDEETYSYLLDAKYPNVEFQNYGSGGYGTLQPYMLYKRIFNSPKDKKTPDLVIYAYFCQHKDRNTVSPNWAFALTDSHGRTVNPPHALFDESGSLVMHPYSVVSPWLLEGYSALVTELHKRARLWQLKPRSAQRDSVTLRLISDMNDYVRGQGSKFLVLALHPTDFLAPDFDKKDDAMIGLIKEKGIDSLVCKHQYWDSFVKDFKEGKDFKQGKKYSDLMINGWGHPSPIWHKHWADCVSAYLDEKKLLD